MTRVPQNRFWQKPQKTLILIAGTGYLTRVSRQLEKENILKTFRIRRLIGARFSVNLMAISSENKKFLLNLAKESIKCFLNTGKKIEFPKNYISPELQENGAVFVTLTIGGRLRGCIGNLLAFRPLYLDVIENSIAGAFYDPRFKPISSEELKQINIEISILGKPAKLEYETVEELIDFLDKEKPGIILRKNAHNATFLPQVWDDLKTPEEFLSHLCLKAGLPLDEWRKGDLEIEFYPVRIISEN